MLCALISPESPVFFVRRGVLSKAKKSYAKPHSTETADTGIQRIEATLEHERHMQNEAKDTTWAECFRGSNWRRTRIVFYANVLQQFVGIAMIVNDPYFMELGGMSPANSIMVITIPLCLSIVSLIVSWYTMNKFGRRIILFCSPGAVGALWLGIGIAGCFNSVSALLCVVLLLCLRTTW
jgi:SP family general alpha glucoside:H+ symporter-like MFS transporter